ncbi:MAG: efflux RND transporter periplasmic adaptor subunit [Acidobacteriota bacterium]
MPWILRIAVAALALGLAIQLLRQPVAPAVAQDQPTPPPVPVKVAKAVEVPLSSTLWVPGTVVSRNDARVAAEIAGRLEWVAEIGDEVRRGDILARIDDRALQLSLREAETRIQRLTVNLSYLERQESRLQALEAEQIAARNQLDEIVSRREMAQQELVEARLARDQAQDRLDRAQLKAPFPGQIVERLQQLGEYTSVGGAVVRLVDVRHPEVRAQAPLTVAPHLQRGMDVAVKEGEVEAQGRVRAVIPVGDERSRMFEIRVELPPTGAEAPHLSPWVIGAALRVALPQSDTRTAVAVPRDALILRQDNVHVFKVTATGTVERIDVETGIGEGSRIEVRGAIQAGDRVVVRGGERLQAGQAVVVQ